MSFDSRAAIATVQALHCNASSTPYWYDSAFYCPLITL
jgi:hypothetical protein